MIGFGHPVYTIADPRNKVIKEVAQQLSQEAGSMKMFDIAERLETVMWDAKKMFAEPRLVQRGVLPHDGRADRDVHAAVRDLAHVRLGRAHHRAAHRQQDHPPERQLHRSRRPDVRAAREALTEGDNRLDPAIDHIFQMNTANRKPLPGTKLDYFDARAAVEAIQPGA